MTTKELEQILVKHRVSPEEYDIMSDCPAIISDAGAMLWLSKNDGLYHVVWQDRAEFNTLIKTPSEHEACIVCLKEFLRSPEIDQYLT